MYFVYVLQSIKDKSFYIGYSNDVKSRLREHNFGRTGYTKYKRPWKLVYKEEYLTRAQAVSRERQLKKLKSRIALEKITRLAGP